MAKLLACQTEDLKIADLHPTRHEFYKSYELWKSGNIAQEYCAKMLSNTWIACLRMGILVILMLSIKEYIILVLYKTCNYYQKYF